MIISTIFLLFSLMGLADSFQQKAEDNLNLQLRGGHRVLNTERPLDKVAIEMFWILFAFMFVLMVVCCCYICCTDQDPSPQPVLSSVSPKVLSNRPKREQTERASRKQPICSQCAGSHHGHHTIKHAGCQNNHTTSNTQQKTTDS
jgi:hypothetical protein